MLCGALLYHSKKVFASTAEYCVLLCEGCMFTLCILVVPLLLQSKTWDKLETLNIVFKSLSFNVTRLQPRQLREPEDHQKVGLVGWMDG